MTKRTLKRLKPHQMGLEHRYIERMAEYLASTTSDGNRLREAEAWRGLAQLRHSTPGGCGVPRAGLNATAINSREGLLWVHLAGHGFSSAVLRNE